MPRPEPTPPEMKKRRDERDFGRYEDEARGSGASADDVETEVEPHQDELLDEGVEETFPASDPVSVKRIT